MADFKSQWVSSPAHKFLIVIHRAEWPAFAVLGLWWEVLGQQEAGPA
jgi:hypothetical protein